MAATTGWFLFPAYCFAKPAERPKPVSLLASKGLTQTPDAALQKKIAANETAAHAKKPQADVRALSPEEMKSLFGRGPYRNPSFSGTLPWQRSFRDVNLCNGNLFKSFTDIQVAPGRGQGLVLQRTYNSNDDREGAFGTGWTHAYEIRMEEAGIDPSDETEKVQRTDFFGGKHTYTRDADGLYTPPPYLFDETDSKYDDYIVNGPSAPLEDIEKGMDGTVKHFVHVATNPDASINHNLRACDYIEDRHGNRTTLTYGYTATAADDSTEKKVTQVTDPVGRTLTFTWMNLGTTTDPHYRILQVQGPSGTYRVTYDYYTNPGDPASYLNLWKVHLDPDGLDRVTTYTYASYSGSNGVENGLLASASDAVQTVSYQYVGENNTPTGTVWVNRVTEPAGVEPATGLPRTNSWHWYFNWGNGSFASMWEYMNPNGTGNSSLWTQTLVDNRLRELRIASPYDAAVHERLYDTANNLVYTASYSLMISVPGTAMKATYGPHGNVLTQRVLTQSSQSLTTYYNASKYFQKASVTNERGNTTTFDYYDNQDPNRGNRGNVKWVRDSGYGTAGSPSNGKQYEYAYNPFGQKTAEANLKAIVTRYTYGDAWGNLTQVVQDPDDASAGYTGLKRTTSMLYDASGRVTYSTDPSGNTSSFAYNTLGQPVQASFPATPVTPGEAVLYTYGPGGRTEAVTDGRGTTTLAYEPGSSRVSSVTDPVTGTVSYTYMPTGEKRTVRLPDGKTWEFSYGQTNTFSYSAFDFRFSYQFPQPNSILAKDDPNSIGLKLQRVTDDQGRRVELNVEHMGELYAVRSNQAFDGSGNVTRHVQTNYLYDTTPVTSSDPAPLTISPGRINRVTHHWLQTLQTTSHNRDGGGNWSQNLLSQNDYSYDVSGQRQVNQVTDSSLNTRTESYGYDTLNRLTSVNYGDGQTQGYSFDAMGNRTQKTDSATGTETYATDAANRLLSVSSGNPNNGSYTNDANGNTMTGGGRVNTWDSQNRLVKVVKAGVTSEFTYGSDGLRRRSIVTNAAGEATQTDYVYDVSMMVAETVRHYTGGSQVGQTENVSYLQGPSGPLYRKSSLQADPKWYVYDGLGSVVGEIDVLGNLSATKSHDVYGLTRGVTGNPTSRQGFVGGLGHVSDDETGLVYMRARHYDPSVGRFESEDPAKDGLNWFGYCGNNPINFVDETGRARSGLQDYTLAWMANLLIELMQRVLMDKFLGTVLSKSFERQAISFFIDKALTGWSEVVAGGEYLGMGVKDMIIGGVGAATCIAITAYIWQLRLIGVMKMYMEDSDLPETV